LAEWARVGAVVSTALFRHFPVGISSAADQSTAFYAMPVRYTREYTSRLDEDTCDAARENRITLLRVARLAIRRVSVGGESRPGLGTGAWEDSLAAYAADTIDLALERRRPESCVARGQWQQPGGDACRVLDSASYSCRSPIDVDVAAVRSSIRASQEGRTTSARLWTNNPGRVAPRELTELARLVVASATARPSTPYLDWWPNAAWLLLLTLDSTDAEVRTTGCSAFVAMRLLRACTTGGEGGVSPQDVAGLRSAVRCLGLPKCAPTGTP
jgi:hypothetical protein